MSAVARWLPLLGVTLAATLFAWFNRGERAVVGVGFTTFYRVPLTFVVFLAFLTGMLAMLLLSLRHDLLLRRELRARGMIEGAEGVERSPAAAPGRQPGDPVLMPRFGEGPVPEAESAAIRVVPPDPEGP